MRKLLLFALIISFPSIVFAQYKKEIGIIVGSANYLGELGGKEKNRRDFILDMKLGQSRSNLGFYYRQKLKPKVFVTGTFNHAILRGADTLSLNPGRNGRRLDFKNNVFEIGVLGEYVLYQSNGVKGRGGRGGGGRGKGSKKDFRAYITGGVAWFHHNPKGTDADGNWVELQPLGTEGQGTQGKPGKYKLSGIAIPLGAGFNYTLNRNYRVGLELGWRTTFTDYLDDVSTVYVNPTVFAGPSGDKTTDLYKQKVYFYDKSDKRSIADPTRSEVAADGTNYGYDFARGFEQKRGDDKHKDSYLLLQIKAGYVLTGKSKFYRKKSSYVSRSKYKKRRVRAKF